MKLVSATNYCIICLFVFTYYYLDYLVQVFMVINKYVISAQISYNFNFCSTELTLLYQPITGAKALGLYLLLCQEYSLAQPASAASKGNLLEYLLQVTQMNRSQFELAMQHLEAVGLVRTFLRKKSLTYNFKLRAPLTADEFFSHADFVKLLKSKLSKYTYDALCQRLNINEKDESEFNISSSFDEMFDQSDCQNQQGWKATFVAVNKYLHAAGLDSNLYRMFKPDIIGKIKLLKINREQLPALIAQSYLQLNGGLLFSFRQFSDIVDKLYLRSNGQAGEEMSLQKIFRDHTSVLENKIHEMEFIGNVNYLELLYSSQDLPFDVAAFDIIRGLSVNYNFSNGIINCLLEYVFLANEYKLHSQTVFALAEMLKDNAVGTTREAILFLRKNCIPMNGAQYHPHRLLHQ